MAGNKGRRQNRKGRSKFDEQFVPLPYSTVESDAWQHLSPAAVKVFIELRHRYNGHNNGKLTLSLDEGARLLHMGKATIARALKELEEKGFIKLVKRGRWYGRMASEYAVTDRRLNGELPTRAWKDWRPPEKPESG